MRKKTLSSYIYSLGILLICSLIAISCNKETTTDSSGISDELHISFTTPDWNRFIPCHLLDFDPLYLNDSTYYVHASSASTKLIYFFSTPNDSSSMMDTSKLRKYPICDYGMNKAPFDFSIRVPITEGSMTYLGSQGNVISDSSYNEVTKISYVSSDSIYASFKVKCKYKMITYEYGTTKNRKNVSGTFNFIVKVNKK